VDKSLARNSSEVELERLRGELSVLEDLVARATNAVWSFELESPASLELPADDLVASEAVAALAAR